MALLELRGWYSWSLVAMRPLRGARMVLRELKLALQGRSPDSPGATAMSPADQGRAVFYFEGFIWQLGRVE